MSEQEVMEKVVEIVRPYTRDKEALANVSLETHFLGDLKINSARLVDVVLAFEDTFNIEVADEDADSVETVGDAVQLIQSKLA